MKPRAWIGTRSRLTDWEMAFTTALPAAPVPIGNAVSAQKEARVTGRVARCSPFGRLLVRSGPPPQTVPFRVHDGRREYTGSVFVESFRLEENAIAVVAVSSGPIDVRPVHRQ